MPLSSRTFIVCVFFGLIFWFLHPSFVYYIETPANLRSQIEDGSWEYNTTLSDQDKAVIARALEKRNLAVTLGLDIKGGVSILAGVDENEIKAVFEKRLQKYESKRRDEIISQIMAGLKNRINQFGLADIAIRKMGDSNISIQVPGVQDVNRIVSIIQQQGLLEFHFVDEESTYRLSPDDPESSFLPEGSSLHYFVQRSEDGTMMKTAAVVLFDKVELDGDVLANANVYRDNIGQMAVGFDLSADGAEKFSDLTARNIGKRLAITLDGNVISAPKINSRINGHGQIEGNFSYQEGKDLALILRSGSLPVPIEILSTNIVGPTMGQELLKKSFIALGLGFFLILGFMLFWYRSFGLIASFALVVNVLMIFSILAQMNFTVSLASLAGVILTAGVSIDANVIIFERIIDEFRENKSFVLSIEGGYQKAFWTIFDANITTLISTLVLAYFGDSFVEGFAFTLFIGVLSSMFSALFMTRFIFDVLIRWKFIKQYRWWYL